MSKAVLPANTLKGRIAESLVAALHENDDSTQVECNVKLPAKNGSGRTREVDVLLTGSVGGYTLRVAIECKNYSKRIGVEKIGEFADKLRDVGLPRENSIFVSAVGFTKDALERAADYGIRPLLLEGLDDNRLGARVFGAIGSTLYIVPTLVQTGCNATGIPGLDLTHRPELNAESLPTTVFDVNQNRDLWLADIAATVWNQGLVDPQLGLTDVTLDFRDDYTWALNFEGHTMRLDKLTLSFEIKALAYTLTGQGERFALRDVVSQSLVKHKQEAHFPPHFIRNLTELKTQGELEAYQKQCDAITGEEWHFTRVIHLPRVKCGDFYHPVSQRVQDKIIALPHWPRTPEEWREVIGMDLGQIGWEE